MKIRTQSAQLWLTATLTCVLFGCGGGSDFTGDLVPVTGTVTMQGKPLAGAQVLYAPTDNKGQAANGVTDEQGKYSLTTPKAGEGAVPGEYNVSISKFIKPDGSPVPKGTFPADVGAVESIPPAYSIYGQSRLKATVPKGGDEINFLIE